MMKTQQHKQAERLLGMLPGEPLHPGEYRRLSLRPDHALWPCHVYYDVASQPGLPIVQLLIGNEQQEDMMAAALTYVASERIEESPVFPAALMEPVCEVGNGRYWPIADTHPLLMFDRDSGHVVSWHHRGVVTRYELEQLIARLERAA